MMQESAEALSFDLPPKTAREEMARRIDSLNRRIAWLLDQADEAEAKAADHRAAADEQQALRDGYVEILEQTS